ncbi:MAG: hypothetical protein MJZ28_12525 [Paludibacteraceae bacterium]|nr:hypothetical protein [Paludibacteraceae bacterium]
MNKETYIQPSITTIELELEGILATSPITLEIDPSPNNGGFSFPDDL